MLMAASPPLRGRAFAFAASSVYLLLPAAFRPRARSAGAGRRRRRRLATTTTTTNKPTTTTTTTIVRWTDPYSGSERRLPLLSHHHLSSLPPREEEKEEKEHETDVSGRRYLDAIEVGDATRASFALDAIRSGGSALVYVGNYGNARQLLTALTRRTDAYLLSAEKGAATATTAEQWERYRFVEAERARLTNMLLMPVDPQFGFGGAGKSGSGRRPAGPRDGPAVLAALRDCFLKDHIENHPYAMPLREMLGAVGARQWRERGLYVPQLGEKIHPHFGVFAPTRSEYLDLVARAEVPPVMAERDGGGGGGGGGVMMDVGVGTGVLTAMLLSRHPGRRAIGTDVNPRAIECARDNLSRLGLSDRAELVEADVFPPDLPPNDGGGGGGSNIVVANKADLIVCNPPWIPGPVRSALDGAVYDEKSSFLRRFLTGAGNYLTDERDDAEVWLVLSDLPERLGLRSRDVVEEMAEAGGLRMMGAPLTATARHPKAKGATKKRKGGDRSGAALFPAVAKARAEETTRLFRFRRR